MNPPHTTTGQKLTRCRVQLILKQPFFGTLSLRLKLAPGTLPTMATDGSRIVYNPAFVDQLKPAELEGTLAHEVMHYPEFQTMSSRSAAFFGLVGYSAD